MSRHANRSIAATGGLVMAAGLMAAPPALGATVLVSDNFEYADNAAMLANYTVNNGSFGLNTTGFNPIPDTAAPGEDPATVPASITTKLGRFNTGTAGYALRNFDGGATATADKGWTLKFDMVLETFARNGGIGVLDSSGNGYAMQWNSSNPNQQTGRGIVSIGERSGAVAAQSYGTLFTNGLRPVYTNGANYALAPVGPPTSYSTGNTGNGYHPVIGYRILATDNTTNSNTQTYDTNFSGLASFTLVYDPDYTRTVGATTETGARLALYNTGSLNPDHSIPIFDVVDTSPFASSFAFSRLYMTGVATDFDNVSLELTPVPEPAVAGLMLVCGGVLIARGRRRAD